MWNQKLVSAICLPISSIFMCIGYSLAQPIPDTTLGRESSVVVPSLDTNGKPSTRIEGGASRGANLFHSFQQFGVGKEQSVYLSNPANINNIFIRVTGSNTSTILGTLGITGNANLFLLNPNGVIFGSDASLNLNGSFLATTASSLSFADGTQFSATVPQNSSLLTVSAPIGLQFGNRNANIGVQGAILQLQPGKTLGLVGGDIVISSAYLEVPTGRIELGSVAKDSSVSLTLVVDSLTLGYENVRAFQDINIKRSSNPNDFASQIFTGGEGSGSIHLQGRQIVLADDSQIVSSTNGAGIAGSITVDASELFLIDGKTSEVSTLTTNAGNGGDVTINTKRLRLQNGGGISTDSGIFVGFDGQISRATGNAGNLTINATESVELTNGSSLSSEAEAFGDAGNIIINTTKLNVRESSQVSVSSTSPTGDAGKLEIKARSIFLDERGKIAASSQSGRGGGNINIQNQGLLLLQHNSEISTNAASQGNGGNIDINTNVLVTLDSSKITAQAIAGRGGYIDISTKGLFISPDSIISASSEQGISGEVEINRTESEPERALSELPDEPVDIANLIAQGCSIESNIAKGSKFVVTGRGGLPPTPQEALRTELALVDLGSSVSSQGSRATAITANQPMLTEPVEIVEAQGWTINSKGEVILTALAANVTPEIPWLTSPRCHS